MKKIWLTILLMTAAACAEVELYGPEHKDGSGGIYYIDGTNETISDASYGEISVTGRGGVAYITGNGSLTLAGVIAFDGNVHNATNNDGVWIGEWNDIYVESGSITASVIVQNRLYVATSAGYDIQMDAADGTSFGLTEVSVTRNSMSGTISGACITLTSTDRELIGESSGSLSNLTFADSAVFVDVAAVASNVFIGADSSISGNGLLVLSGNNAIVINSEYEDSTQLDGVILGDGTLTITLTDEQLSAALGGETTVVLTGTSVQEGADVAIVSNDAHVKVVGYTADETGVIITISAVPEPTPATLSLLVLMAFAARRRRI